MAWKRNNKTFGLGRLKSGEMNRTEKAYSDHLENLKIKGQILWWSFEGIKFKLAEKCHYSPDFTIMNSDGEIEIHEVKGSLYFIQDDAKVKIKVAARQFPFRFFLVAPLPKKSGGGWEISEVE